MKGNRHSQRTEASPDSVSNAKHARHHDEEQQFGAPSDSTLYIDQAVQKRVLKKLDWNLVTLVFWLFLLSFLDRSNVGNAYTAGMGTDLRFDANGEGPHTYDWLLTIFYISYIIFQFGTLGWKLAPPHIWAASVVFLWGLCSTLQSAAFNWSGMMAARFFLGAIEACYGPGIVYYLSFFYLRHEVGFRQGLFLSGAPLATCFAGALAYGITHEKGHVSPWRLLFVVEGIPTVLMAPIVWFCLPDSPNTARFLSTEEKQVAAARAVRQAGTSDRVGGFSLDWKDALKTFADPKALLTGLMYFSCNVAYGSLPVFLPTLLKTSLGFSAINSQGLTAPPYFLSFIITFVTPWLADKTRQRGLFIIGLSCIGGVGYILLATVHNIWVRYAGVFLAAAGVFPAIANVLPWVTNNQGNDTRRGMGVVILNLIGQCGPILGTRVYPTTDGPDFVKGHSVCAAFMFFNALLALTLRTYLSWQNRVMDKKYGTVADQNAREALEKGDSHDAVAAENFGPKFRYIL